MSNGVQNTTKIMVIVAPIKNWHVNGAETHCSQNIISNSSLRTLVGL